MGVGKLLIGEGQGAAQIYAPNPGVQMFANSLQKLQAKRDADNKYLADQLASVKPDGLRNDADRQQFFQQYSGLKQQAIDAENETNPMKRAMDIANVRQGMLGLDNYVNQSKQQAVRESDFAKTYMANPSAFSDDAIAAHRASVQMPVNNPALVKDYTTLARNVDPEKIYAQQKQENADLLKQQQWDNPTLKQMTVSGKAGTYQFNSRQVPTDVLYHKDLNKYDSDANFQHFIQQTNKDIFANNDPQTAKALAVQKWVDAQGTIAEHSEPKFIPPNKPDTFYAHWDYKGEHPQGASNAPTPLTTHYIEPARVGTPQDVNKWLELAPTSQFRPGEKPTATVQNGYQVINIPDQVTRDQVAVKANQAIKDKYAKMQANSGVFGFLKNTTPFEQSEKAKKIQPEYKVVKPAYQETLDPNDPVGYHAKAGELSTELKMPVPAINNQAGGKGGRGINPGITNQQPQTSQKLPTVRSQTDYQGLPKGAQYIAPDGTVYTKK